MLYAVGYANAGQSLNLFTTSGYDSLCLNNVIEGYGMKYNTRDMTMKNREIESSQSFESALNVHETR